MTNVKGLAKNVTPDKSIHVSTPAKEAAKEKLEGFMKEETKLVKGRFKNYQNPGGTENICVRKYPKIPGFKKVMTDGEIYEIPLYVARHLNGIDVTASAIGGQLNTCSFAVHGFKYDGKSDALPASGSDDRGIPVPIVGPTKRVRRFGFESLEFGL